MLCLRPWLIRQFKWQTTLCLLALRQQPVLLMEAVFVENLKCGSI